MYHKTNCRFCDIIDGQYRYFGIDEPVGENDDFIAIASIGAMVEGWTLILPKNHQCSMKSLYQKQSLLNIINLIAHKLFNAYGHLIVFEHGANRNGSPTGCGIDHAHLHIVPLRESLHQELKASGLNWITTTPLKIFSIAGDKEYLFYSELSVEKNWLDTVCYIHILERPVPQFFRRLIGKQIGKADTTDYKVFPYLKIAKQTRSTLLKTSL